MGDIVMSECRKCYYSMMRSKINFQRNGNIAFPVECLHPKNEKTPYRRRNDTCKNYKEAK